MENLVAVDERRSLALPRHGIPEDGDEIFTAGDDPFPLMVESRVDHSVPMRQRRPHRRAGARHPHLGFEGGEVRVGTRGDQVTPGCVPLHGTDGGFFGVRPGGQSGETIFQIEHRHPVQTAHGQQVAVGAEGGLIKALGHRENARPGSYLPNRTRLSVGGTKPLGAGTDRHMGPAGRQDDPGAQHLSGLRIKTLRADGLGAGFGGDRIAK